MTDSSSNKSVIKSLWNGWFVIPAGLSSVQRRFYATAAVGLRQAWLVHCLYIFLFSYWGVWPLAIFNVFSVILWTGVIILWRQGRHNLMYTVMALEVIIHAALVMRYLGWGFGVQYYLFVLVLVSFLLPWPRWINWSVTILNTILFILFYYYTQFYPPLTTAPPLPFAIWNMINIISAFVLCAAITLYFSQSSDITAIPGGASMV